MSREQKPEKPYGRKKRKAGTQTHHDNRKKGTVSGVEDVLAFDVNEIRLETELGMLTVRGKELHLSRLSLDQGEVDLEGTGGGAGLFQRTCQGQTQTRFLEAAVPVAAGENERTDL